ncbi:hypothetical protein CHLNCDRAFT_137885 [Chlorella variabilis]|uniref:Uncharacterized protein n=1 Tax=Chlorella variabilis TaxID=554065 RepID=E1Z4R4_CHLVA|nr:hypothetical protein CHLNCDRAFT_137885 [Chlorella variabilis]EFN59395.1 hypothetical protein CHLNCDRAFT_137885 [Chlorella variabilis]|eukprot:XP_005851497.1 hypothetical protein CHLNCDRAFT_137885 [Chlorella variabilis]
MRLATCNTLPAAAAAAAAAPPLRWRPLLAAGSSLAAPHALAGSCLCRRRRQAAAAPAAAALDFATGGSGSGGLELLALPPQAAAQLVGEVGDGLEAPVQLAYLLTLMGFLVVGAYLVVRQVLIRRELEEAAKVLGERVRTNDATSEDYFELGVILLRKKLYTQATKNLEKAQKNWQGEPEELAQVHNALGFAFFNMDKVDAAIDQYRKAVDLQPGYVTAWNNLGDAYERKKDYSPALAAYREVLTYAPDNKVAQARSEYCRTRIERTA